MRQLLGRESVLPEHRPQQQRVRQLSVLGERADHFGGFGAVPERACATGLACSSAARVRASVARMSGGQSCAVSTEILHAKDL